jgi:hypothetical protein
MTSTKETTPAATTENIDSAVPSHKSTIDTNEGQSQRDEKAIDSNVKESQSANDSTTIPIKVIDPVKRTEVTFAYCECQHLLCSYLLLMGHFDRLMHPF